MRPASLLAVLLAALVSVAGCRETGPGDDGGSPDAESTAGESSVADPPSDSLSTLTVLDPYYEWIFTGTSMAARYLVYSPLVGIGENGEFEPRLARSWEHSDDYRVWTFHLRTDVRWHDGEPFTAHDVAFTKRRLGHPAVAHGLKPDTVIVVDESTVTIRKERPWDLREEWWEVYYPEHLLGDVEPSEHFEADFWDRPVGTGPFRYVRSVPKTVYVLEANPDYYRGVPEIDRVRVKFGGGEPLVELRAGNVDVAYVSRDKIPLLREDPELRAYHHLWPYLSWLAAVTWNHRHPFLGEPAVRRALTMAMDREELHRLLYVPDDVPVLDVLFSPRQFREGELPPPVPHDPGKARALLDSAGWRDTDGDGLRTKGPREARFTALVGGSPATTWGKAAVYVQAALGEVGVRMEIQRLERGGGERIHSGRFEAAIRMFNQYENLFSRAPEASFSGYSHGYYDRELDRIFQSLDTVFDPASRDSLYRESWPIFRRDLPATILMPQFRTFAARRRVRGLESPFRGHPYMAAAELRIEEDEP